jgi:hypothetical protein
VTSVPVETPLDSHIRCRRDATRHRHLLFQAHLVLSSHSMRFTAPVTDRGRIVYPTWHESYSHWSCCLRVSTQTVGLNINVILYRSVYIFGVVATTIGHARASIATASSLRYQSSFIFLLASFSHCNSVDHLQSLITTFGRTLSLKGSQWPTDVSLPTLLHCPL